MIYSEGTDQSGAPAVLVSRQECLLRGSGFGFEKQTLKVSQVQGSGFEFRVQGSGLTVSQRVQVYVLVKDLQLNQPPKRYMIWGLVFFCLRPAWTHWTLVYHQSKLNIVEYSLPTSTLPC